MSQLTREETAFLTSARKTFEENADWFEFEEFAFGSRSPLYSKTRSHKDVLTHPLYVALKDMWLELGGKRAGAGRPPTSPTPRRTISLRLPIHLITAAHRRAELEGVTVTEWIETAIARRLRRR